MSNKTPSDKKNSFTETELKILKKLDEQRNKANMRFPLLTALSATFGFVLLLDGFQGIIKRNELLANNPVALMVAGLIILTVTGSVYKKLN